MAGRGRPGSEATKAAIVGAATKVLAEGGSAALGVNAIARAAGCDKQLLYRYFGGLEGIAEAVGGEVARRIDAAMTAAGADFGGAALPRPYVEAIEALLLVYLSVLRQDPLLRAVVAAEIAAPSPLVETLSRARMEALQRFAARWLKGAAPPPTGLDAPAINAVLIAAIERLALAGAMTGAFAGVSLSDDRDWDRLRRAIRHLVRGALSP